MIPLGRHVQASQCHSKILNDEGTFTKLCNEFHNETPLIVIENCFLLVLANITSKLFLYFLLYDIENLS